MGFTDFSVESFLADYWQKRPLFIKNPWADWRNPLAPDELAGLACEEEIESRLIIKTRDNWKVEHGPFAESRFGKLGKKQWTLLVQAVDHHVPDVAALINPFRFIPGWRIDDVMVSYATDGGGVGPHFDQYDVFLIQGLGKRRWQVGPRADSATPLMPHNDLRLLADFQATDDWICEAGDILYVPPGFAHHGVAVGDDCMTYSIGFRAPSRSDLITHYCDHLLDGMQDDDRYTDDFGTDPATGRNPGEISAPEIARLHEMLMNAMADRATFARWFGEYNSTKKYSDGPLDAEHPATPAEIRHQLECGAELCCHPASRFSFIRTGTDAITLFADGESFEREAEAKAFAERLCAHHMPTVEPDWLGSVALLSLIAALYAQGSLTFADAPSE